MIRKRLFLEDFEVLASIGIHPAEREARQRVLVNVTIELAEEAWPAEDSIGEVLDYDFLRIEIGKLVADRHFNLQETLCQAILDRITRRDGVRRVRVSTRKTDVYPDCRSVGCEIDWVAGA